MGDYLQNIVLRSLSLADVVQPRVPQLFEHTSAPGPVSDGSSQTETVQTAPVFRDPISEVQPHREVKRPTLENEEHSTSVAEERNRDHHLPFTIRRDGPTTIVENPSPASLVPTVRALDSGTVANPVSKPAHAETPPESQPEQSQPGPLWREPSIAMIDQNPPALSNTRLQPSAANRGLPSLAQNLRAEPQPLPVKITIGRVDVRAIMPSGPPRSAASVRPKPALSLESYLKQREEGKR